MSETVTKVPTAARVEAIELRNGDLALAVLELANVIERLVVGTVQVIGACEAESALKAIDNARALATPEDDDDPEPEPASSALVAWLTPEKQANIDAMHAAAAAQPKSRYWIDLRNGDGYGTQSTDIVLRHISAGDAINIRDCERGEFIVFRGILERPDLLAAEAA